MIEPIQGEAGIIVPPDGYLREAARLCKENKVLLICDEIQSGLKAGDAVALPSVVRTTSTNGFAVGGVPGGLGGGAAAFGGGGLGGGGLGGGGRNGG